MEQNKEPCLESSPDQQQDKQTQKITQCATIPAPVARSVDVPPITPQKPILTLNNLTGPSMQLTRGPTLPTARVTNTYLADKDHCQPMKDCTQPKTPLDHCAPNKTPQRTVPPTLPIKPCRPANSSSPETLVTTSRPTNRRPAQTTVPTLPTQPSRPTNRKPAQTTVPTIPTQTGRPHCTNKPNPHIHTNPPLNPPRANPTFMPDPPPNVEKNYPPNPPSTPSRATIHEKMSRTPQQKRKIEDMTLPEKKKLKNFLEEKPPTSQSEPKKLKLPKIVKKWKEFTKLDGKLTLMTAVDFGMKTTTKKRSPRNNLQTTTKKKITKILEIAPPTNVTPRRNYLAKKKKENEENPRPPKLLWKLKPTPNAPQSQTTLLTTTTTQSQPTEATTHDLQPQPTTTTPTTNAPHSQPTARTTIANIQANINQPTLETQPHHTQPTVKKLKPGPFLTSPQDCVHHPAVNIATTTNTIPDKNKDRFSRSPIYNEMQCHKQTKPEPEMRETDRERSSTSPLPTTKLLTVENFTSKDVENSTSSTARKLKFGGGEEAANQMPQNRDTVAGLHCDEKCREDASP